MERQQTILEKVQERQGSITEMACPQHPPTWLKELQKETFEILPGTVNDRCTAGIAYMSGFSQNLLVSDKAFFEDELAEESQVRKSDSHLQPKNIRLKLQKAISFSLSK